MSTPQMVTEPLADHGESVIWDPYASVVRWVDMLAGDILTLESEDHVTRRHVSSMVTAIRPRARGGLVAATERSFALLDASLDVEREFPPLWASSEVRMNDGACDPAGRFFAGSMAVDETPGRGSLYRLDVDGEVSVALRGVSISNGLVWTLDGTTAYYVDSATQRVDAFDFDPTSGTLGIRRTVVEIDRRAGVPDGITLDREGFLWVALWEGSAVRRYAPNGRLDGIIELPARFVTSCAFAGRELDELYITTSRSGKGDKQAHAGALFRVMPGVMGSAIGTFGG